LNSRTVLSASQAACLYTVLFFAPDVLHRDAALMRVLVDKHFVDNWVLAWAPGITSDIAEEWASHKARSPISLRNPLSARQAASCWSRT
jgi:WASH complex subunit strumpellin